jgi:hypothetical protein
MKFVPKTREELQQMNLLPDGVYTFEVIESVNTISKTSGNEMIKLTLKVWDHNGVERIITDYLIEAYLFKLLSFCEATNLLEKYNSGILLDTDCYGKIGKVYIVIKKGKPVPNDPEGKMYPDSNSIKEYIKQDKSYESNKKQESDIPFDDELPF